MGLLDAAGRLMLDPLRAVLEPRVHHAGAAAK
jgi:hypothetical protein